ncbi:MAG: KUP/HAK/KT family potassium transporter [Mycoplasmatales bacterium]
MNNQQHLKESDSTQRSHHNLNKITLASLLMTIGIVYGDIGTSPLYVMSSVLHSNNGLVQTDYILGAISLVIWTLILQTTIKYVWQVLRADNNGEGGILSLYSLIKKNARWILVVAIIGTTALLADSIITPAVTVTSAIEGLDLVVDLNRTTIILIVIGIISSIFLIQRSGTTTIGKMFGPIMVLWFSLLAILGLIHIFSDLSILKAFNPYYGFILIKEGFVTGKIALILGSIFLCTTGAEALYSDLGHCGRKNIYYTWIFVKTCLILNYLGQGAMLLGMEGQIIEENPFFMMMPTWFIPIGIIIATSAAIIASQSLISGSFTLVSEAIKLRLLPRLQLLYPSTVRGQVYIPTVNIFLYIGCIFVVLFFQTAAKMEAAYGLSITITMLMTTILFFNYLLEHKISKLYATAFLITYLIIEGSFLYANLFKFAEGGYITVVFGTIIGIFMLIWIYGNRITDSTIESVSLKDYKQQILELQADKEVAQLCSNLVYLTKVPKRKFVEQQIIFSLLERQPKRADVYWFVNVVYTHSPFTSMYKVETIEKNKIYKVQFFIGFRIQPKIGQLLRTVINDLIETKEFEPIEKKYSMSPKIKLGNFKFIMFEDVFTSDEHLSRFANFVLRTKLAIKKVTVTPIKWFGLDTSSVVIEKYPLILTLPTPIQLTRILLQKDAHLKEQYYSKHNQQIDIIDEDETLAEDEIE